MGSRNEQTIVYWDCDIFLVQCGCFSGTLLQFENTVVDRYGANEHGNRYLDFINLVWTMMEV